MAALAQAVWLHLSLVHTTVARCSPPPAAPAPPPSGPTGSVTPVRCRFLFQASWVGQLAFQAACCRAAAHRCLHMAVHDAAQSECLYKSRTSLTCNPVCPTNQPLQKPLSASDAGRLGRMVMPRCAGEVLQLGELCSCEAYGDQKGMAHAALRGWGLSDCSLCFACFRESHVFGRSWQGGFMTGSRLRGTSKQGKANQRGFRVQRFQAQLAIPVFPLALQSTTCRSRRGRRVWCWMCWTPQVLMLACLLAWLTEWKM